MQTPPTPTVPSVPTTGPEAISHALSKLNLDNMEQDARATIASGAKSKRPKAVHVLNVIEGLKRNNLTPSKLMINHVPVIPPAFRPFNVIGDTLMVGDANELYRDLFQYKDVYDQSHKIFGAKGSGKSFLDLYDSVKAVHGFGEPLAPKTKQRGVSGFLKQITGTNPKYSFVQDKLVSKLQDSVARGAITPDPELMLDEIGIPEEMAWTMYAPYIQRRLVQSGMKPADALLNVVNKSDQAKKALQAEVQVRPVLYSRAPAWHKYNSLAGRPKLIEGNNIAISPLVSTGLGADYDGDEVLNQIYACIPHATVVDCSVMSYSTIQHHTIRFAEGSRIPALQGHTTYMFDLEDFPHGKLLNTKEGAKGRIDFHAVPEGIKVLAYDERTKSLKWANVACWSKHYSREIEIVDTHNGYQIVTDDDPRAVYGVAAGTIDFRRFTPTQATQQNVLVPRMRVVPKIKATTLTVPGLAVSDKNRGYIQARVMRSQIPLTADIGWFLGAVCGDGWVIKDKNRVYGVGLSDNEGYNIANLQRIMGSLFASDDDSLCNALPELFPNTENAPTPNKVVMKAGHKGRYGDTVSYRFPSKYLGLWIRNLLGGARDETTSGSANKHLPYFYLSAPEDFRMGLFAGLLDTDGSIAVSRAKAKPQLMANFASTSIRLIQETKLLAASLGISGRITPSKTPLGNKCWTLSFSNKDIQNWNGKYMVHQEKLDKLRSVPKIEESPVTAKYDIVPLPESLAVAFCKNIGCPKLKKSDREEGGVIVEQKKKIQNMYICANNARTKNSKAYGYLSRKSANEIINYIGASFIANMPEGKAWLEIVLNTEITWEKVTNVQKTGIKEDGYDLTVPGFETFMSADGIILSNTMNIHVPSMPESVKEAYEKLLPSKMLFSIKNPEKVMPELKHEILLGLYVADKKPAQTKHIFRSEDEALRAIKAGAVRLSDEVEIRK